MSEKSSIDTANQPPCQQIQDEQGYLILGCYRKYRIGEVFQGFNGGFKYSHVEASAVVISEATREEWFRQCANYAGRIPNPVTPNYFYKVRAE